MRTCKYKECNETIPEGSRVLYHDHKCYKKQQKIDGAIYREKKRKAKRGVMIDCKYEECDKQFSRLGAKAYCCQECRDAQREINTLSIGSVVTGQKVEIPKDRLERGKIHYSGYVTL